MKKSVDSHYFITLIHYSKNNKGEMVEDTRSQIADIKGKGYAYIFFKSLLEMYRKAPVEKYSWYERATSNENEELWVELK